MLHANRMTKHFAEVESVELGDMLVNFQRLNIWLTVKDGKVEVFDPHGRMTRRLAKMLDKHKDALLGAAARYWQGG